MNIIFSADYHLKLGQKNVPKDWATNRYINMFEQLHELEAKSDMHIIGGDIFDKLPSMEELELFIKYCSGVRCKVIIYPGNHESVKRDTTFLTFLKHLVTLVNPLVEIIDEACTIDDMDFLPYNRLKDFEKGNLKHKFTGSVLFTHVRGEIPPHVKPEVDLDIFNSWDVVYTGDLHSHDCCQRNLVYPGSPCTTSFHRSEVQTGILVIDSSKGWDSWEWVALELPQLIRKTIVAGDSMPRTDYHHTIYEVTGDMSELGSVENSDLLDKKVIKKTTDVALILRPNATMAEELVEYLRYILNLQDQEVDELLMEFNSAKLGEE